MTCCYLFIGYLCARIKSHFQILSMKITRSFVALSVRVACVAVLGLGALTANAAPGGHEANATLINFSASEGLKAEDAGKILSNRLDMRQGTDELRSVYTEHPGNGMEVQRFNQYFKGVRVAHGTYTITSKEGVPAYAFGKYYQIAAATSITPTMSEADALSKALQNAGAGKYMWEIDPAVAAPKAELQFVEDYTYGEPDRESTRLNS